MSCQNRLLGPTPRIFYWIGLGWGLRICISNKISRDAPATDVGRTTDPDHVLPYNHVTFVLALFPPAALKLLEEKCFSLEDSCGSSGQTFRHTHGIRWGVTFLVRMNLTAVSYNRYFLNPQKKQMQQTCSQGVTCSQYRKFLWLNHAVTESQHGQVQYSGGRPKPKWNPSSGYTTLLIHNVVTRCVWGALGGGRTMTNTRNTKVYLNTLYKESKNKSTLGIRMWLYLKSGTLKKWWS